jgi:hypothetical protein
MKIRKHPTFEAFVGKCITTQSSLLSSPKQSIRTPSNFCRVLKSAAPHNMSSEADSTTLPLSGAIGSPPYPCDPNERREEPPHLPSAKSDAIAGPPYPCDNCDPDHEADETPWVPNLPPTESDVAGPSYLHGLNDETETLRRDPAGKKPQAPAETGDLAEAVNLLQRLLLRESSRREVQPPRKMEVLWDTSKPSYLDPLHKAVLNMPKFQCLTIQRNAKEMASAVIQADLKKLLEYFGEGRLSKEVIPIVDVDNLLRFGKTLVILRPTSRSGSKDIFCYRWEPTRPSQDPKLLKAIGSLWQDSQVFCRDEMGALGIAPGGFSDSTRSFSYLTIVEFTYAINASKESYPVECINGRTDIAQKQWKGLTLLESNHRRDSYVDQSRTINKDGLIMGRSW